MRALFTTGQIAAICGVAPKTVTKWCDLGMLPSYRIPGSLARRVQRFDLRVFLDAHGMGFADLTLFDGPRPPRKRRGAA